MNNKLETMSLGDKKYLYNTRRNFRKRLGEVGQYALLAPTLLVLIIFFVLPYMNMVRMSFLQFDSAQLTYSGITLNNYKEVFGDSYYWTIVYETLKSGILTTVFAFLLGYPIAYHLAHAKGKWRTFFLFLVLAPLMVGLVIRSYGWMVLLQNNGLVNQLLMAVGLTDEPIELMYNSFGVIVALIHIFLPFMILPIVGSLQGINPDHGLAARSLGATRTEVFFRITFPLSLPGVISGTILVFLMSISAYAIPILLGKLEVMMMSMMVVQIIADALNWPLGSAMAILFFLIAVVLLVIYNQVVGKFVKGLRA
jgi:putative spermidine/putrescine transport system permease protein